MTKVEKKLNALHGMLCDELIESLKEGDGEGGRPAPATLNVIRQFLKDNNIDGTLEEDSPLMDLMKELPADFKESFGKKQ